MGEFGKDQKVETIGDLYDALKKLRGDYSWLYRGHSNLEWKLIPKVGRSSVLVKDEKVYFEAWKRRAIEYVNPAPTDDWDWLSIAQHHGFPTRLLDWTSNPLVAAFFAVTGEHDTDGAIYAFQPKWYVIRDRVHPLEYTGVSRFRPSAFAARISRQSGEFTIHGAANREISDEIGFGELRRYVVPRAMRESMTLDLDQFGYNSASLFPDLDGLSKHLNWIISRRDLRRQILKEDEMSDSSHEIGEEKK